MIIFSCSEIKPLLKWCNKQKFITEIFFHVFGKRIFASILLIQWRILIETLKKSTIYLENIIKRNWENFLENSLLEIIFTENLIYGKKKKKSSQFIFRRKLFQSRQATSFKNWPWSGRFKCMKFSGYVGTVVERLY